MPSRRCSRRTVLAGGVGFALGGAAGIGAALTASDEPASPSAEAHPFYGPHQAGITTAAQDRLHFAAFDVVTDSRAELVEVLRAWTTAAARMTAGEPAGRLGPTSGPYDAPPDDTGEAIGLPPARLTVTFGFGSSLFDDRFGLAARRPAALRSLPHFPADNLDPSRSDGDLCVQACADDPQIAVHAVRNLARIGFGAVAVRWSQLGFGRTSSTTRAQDTPRNLFGFKDGTANIKAEETDALAADVWVAASNEPRERWLEGGSYLVARRINMSIETWDRQSLRDQETIIGRSKAEGAPLSGGGEDTPPNFILRGRGGPLIDPRSHVALAHPDDNDGVRILRRGYNFVDGSTALGRLDAGLFFIAFTNDPHGHYVPMQTKLSKSDLLSEYLQHTASGLFAIPPGVRPGGYVGQQLFA
ncbi:MAG: iron uptake transporter deferrochelatase/peroxidase subunit [Gaiella sp.]|nr:iron uptake transporter deferrochelatase/peroxidase subunit [Gaiella sp.]